ncbi:MAG: putative methyltransferase YcgJ [Verrucomicrobia subdivision 3 bacterium]|nr:putative methyltransferase YcgJ [Limisphaerales bacterium]MCS1413738.1 putative methyltransferase YcgJ [Limisphaerales bacterium]
MISTLKSFRILADITRLRLIVLLRQEELSVNELQEITHMGQSRISTHLGLMQESELLVSRREGKRIFYRLNQQLPNRTVELIQLAIGGAPELPETKADETNLRRIVERRQNQAKVFFDQVAGRLDRSYGPGRSWQAFGHLLLQVVPPLEIADLGSGEGLLSELLALRAKRVIAVDNSPKMVEFGTKKAKQNGLLNLEFRQGDLAEPPINDASVDLVILSQALHHTETPKKAIQSSYRILREGGHVIILDLLKHEFEDARSLYGDFWLGFQESDLHHWLDAAGFSAIDISRVAKEAEPPHFETLMASGVRG